MDEKIISSPQMRPSTRTGNSRIYLSSTYIGPSLSCSLPSKRQRIESTLRVSSDIFTFGKDSPKWTIPSSRPKKLPQLQSPGPGEYNVSSPLIDTKRIYQRMSLSSQEKTRPPLTASIGFIDRPSLVNAKSGIVIGNRDKFEFGQVTSGPGPGHYSPQTHVSAKSHIIASRHDINHSGEIPGPGAYDVSNSMKSQKGSTLSNAPSNRDQWLMEGIEITPGPSDYLPIPTKSKIHHKNKRSKSKNNIVAIDRCIVKLNKIENPEEAEKFLQANKKLKKIINEIYETVLYSKPKDPLQFLREYFLPEKQDPPPPMEEEEDLLLY